MSSSPKSSLVERLVQDRLRSGDLESSAANLLQLGDGAQGRVPDGSGGRPPDLSTGLINGDGGLAAQSFATEYQRDPAPGPVAPVALELRPLAAPAPGAAPPFPTQGFAPSALVPPPATGLNVQGPANTSANLDPAPLSVEQPALEPPAIESRATPSPQMQSSLTPPSLMQPSLSQPVQALSPAPLAAPPIVSQTGTSQTGASQDIERPDLMQGPPTIDAVALERGGMVDWSRTRSRISEEFRLVQRQILRAAFGPGAEPGFSNLLMVTSARPGEGKSFTSVNLAGSIARQGDHHVLLIDADSKRDSFCYALGLAEMRGLLDLVANPKLDPSPLIVKTPIERLSILPVGRERERSAELFSTKEMTRLIQSLGRRYADRLLVLDAPPCLSTSDPAVLAPVVGQILFVVEADRTQRDEVEASLDLIQACPNITLVLNKQQISSRYTFGAYSSYYSS
jgi:receptor protein-tyrosine kinase